MLGPIGLYYLILEFECLSKVEKISEPTDEVEKESDVGKSVEAAISAYRKIKEGKKELTEKELEQLDKECKVIHDREIIEVDPVHEAVEIEPSSKGKIMMGPPTLTRFEKARIMGARALQLSQGAPPFIEIPKGVNTSLDIALSELEQLVIPIVIRRRLPNGDFQNIPIDFFN